MPPTAQARQRRSAPAKHRSDPAGPAGGEEQVPRAAPGLALLAHLVPAAGAAEGGKEAEAAIRAVGEEMAAFRVVGSSARCGAMLGAVREVVGGFEARAGTSVGRELPGHLATQATHLARARPLSAGMATALRHVQAALGGIGGETPDDEAKALVCRQIDKFLEQRVFAARQSIADLAAARLGEDAVVMTFGHSDLIRHILLHPRLRTPPRRVIVLDAGPSHESSVLLRSLARRRIPTTYLLLPAIASLLAASPPVSCLLLGAQAVLGNGALYARAGTALVALFASTHNIPVVCCCETYKFTDRVMLDSISANELATPQSALAHHAHHHHHPFNQIPTLLPPVGDGRDDPAEVSLLYDVTRPEDVSMIITEAGIFPPQTAPMAVRDYQPLVQG